MAISSRERQANQAPRANPLKADIEHFFKQYGQKIAWVECDDAKFLITAGFRSFKKVKRNERRFGLNLQKAGGLPLPDRAGIRAQSL